MGGISTVKIFRPVQPHFGSFYSEVATQVTESKTMIMYHHYNVQCGVRWYLDSCLVTMEAHDQANEPFFLIFNFSRYQDIFTQIHQFQAMQNEFLFKC